MNKILDAAAFAWDAHKDQKRKYTGEPFAFHPARVACRVALLPGVTEDTVVASFLHDVVEDTEVKLYTIRQRFGDVVGDLVAALTKSVFGRNRAERKANECARLARVSMEAKQIKMVDRIDNLSDLMQCGDPEFLKLYVKESRDLIAVIGDADAALRQELIALCDKIG